ncbi:MAG TPA: SPOR domain-containing protein [Burkholderiales bacterium]|jgi:cell division protein FtsN|nr:SPOR domain-containing protein [Burkholderiales bacterium]
MRSRPRNLPATRKRSSGGFLLGMFVGLFIGLTVSLMVAFYLNKSTIPFLTAKKPADREAVAAKPPAMAGLPGGQAPAVSAEKPKFDFYKILPGQEEPVSEKELRERMRSARSQQEFPKDVYFIQAGSFQNPADADNQKARLAILGFESSVEPANLPDKGTWYRVRLGPYNKLDEINRIRQALAQNNIDASLVKIKEPQAR